MPGTPTVQERTMRVREVLMRAVQREISWIQAADILGISARNGILLIRHYQSLETAGNAFGPGGDGFARMCYATEYSKIEEALHRMEKFMTRYG